MFQYQVFFINYSWSTSVTHDICSNRNPKLGWWLGWWLWVVSSDDISHRVCYLICIPVSRISLGWNRLIGLLLKFSDNTIWLVWKNSKRPKMEIIYLGTPLRRRKNNTPPPTPPANTKTQQPPAPIITDNKTFGKLCWVQGSADTISSIRSAKNWSKWTIPLKNRLPILIKVGYQLWF